jgi:hypothetical protein
MNDCIRDDISDTQDNINMHTITDYNIAIEGEYTTHGNGAIRYSKNKGRFDLIPEDVLLRLIKTFNAMKMDEFDISISKITEECWADNYISTIIRLTAYHYFPNDIKDIISVIDEKELSDIFFSYLHIMLNDLAIHFQKGAETYGERNCQKGLPLWSFKDSGRRHLSQYVTGFEDEPHHVSVIWNMWMADWAENNSVLSSTEDNDSVLPQEVSGMDGLIVVDDSNSNIIVKTKEDGDAVMSTIVGGEIHFT